MLSQIVAHNEDYIEIIRVHHHYYVNERQSGFILSMNHHVQRDEALEKVKQNTGGIIPAACNFDVCLPHSWKWRLDRDPAKSEYIPATVRVAGRTFRGQVKKIVVGSTTIFGIFYNERMVVLRQLGDGTFCELETAIVGD